MNHKTTNHLIDRLAVDIVLLQQGSVLGGLTKKEREALELLKDAQLKLIESDEKRQWEDLEK